MTTIESHKTNRLLQRAAEGDRSSIGDLLKMHRAEMRQAVDIRMSPRLRSKRVDASDVVQEAEAEAFERLDDFLVRRPMSFRLWLRKTALERLAKVRRRHIQVAKRSVDRELSLSAAAAGQLSQCFVNVQDSPGQHAMQRDLNEHVKLALGELAEQDQEILLMRHIEKMTNGEIAQVLDLSPAAVSKRHVRSLVKLRSLLHQRGIEVSGP